jgi:hypothetical protein
VLPLQPDLVYQAAAKLTRNEVISSLGHGKIKHICDYADVLHCELNSKVADEYIESCRVKLGNFDNIAACRYSVPIYWDLGKVCARLVQDVTGNIFKNDKSIQMLNEVYGSWISDSISNFNSDFFYRPHDYIKECYLAGKIL